jgi:hypothetical protein
MSYESYKVKIFEKSEIKIARDLCKLIIEDDWKEKYIK